MLEVNELNVFWKLLCLQKFLCILQLEDALTLADCSYDWRNCRLLSNATNISNKLKWNGNPLLGMDRTFSVFLRFEAEIETSKLSISSLNVNVN